MSAADNLAPADLALIDQLHVPLDMDAITRACLNSPRAREYTLEFTCHGRPWHWTGKAVGKGTAELLALDQLTAHNPDFDRHQARLVACVEV